MFIISEKINTVKLHHQRKIKISTALRFTLNGFSFLPTHKNYVCICICLETEEIENKPQKKLELINEFSKVTGYKINTEICWHFYTLIANYQKEK